MSAVTVHGRTVEQRYRGPSNWEFLARVKRHVGSGTILGSGNLFTADTVCRKIAETGVDGVTLARGAIGSTFIFREVAALLDGGHVAPPPHGGELGKAIRFQMTESVVLYGDACAGRIFRKFRTAYSALHPKRAVVREAFIGAATTDVVMEVIDSGYDPGRDWCEVRPWETLRDLVAAGAG